LDQKHSLQPLDLLYSTPESVCLTPSLEASRNRIQSNNELREQNRNSPLSEERLKYKKRENVVKKKVERNVGKKET